EARAERDLGADDAVTAEEILFATEHVHGAALALRVTAPSAGQLSHHAPGVHVARQHVAMVAIAGDDLVAVRQRHLHADDDGFLADIKVTEAADRAHAVEL